MRQILKLSLFILANAVLLSSCLKERNDIGGLRTDDGSVAVTIAEVEYINQDNNVIGFGYYSNANFSYTSLPTEDVKFFTIRVAQPRSTKVNGSLKLKISYTSIGSDPLPAGAIVIPADVEFPAFEGASKDFSVKFKVQKNLLVPGSDYAARFTITGTNQGAVSQTGNSIDVYFHDSKYYGRYMCETTITDPAGVIKMDKNLKPVLLDDPNYWQWFTGTSTVTTSGLCFVDEYYAGLTFAGPPYSISTASYATHANNLTSGTTAVRYNLVNPTFQLNASDNLTAVLNSLTGANYGVTLNAESPNKFTYTANDDRTFEISYNVTLTAPLPVGTSSRSFKVTEKYTYHPIQVRVF
jgi:hypothetical protein